MWSVPEALPITAEQRRTLEAWIRARNSPQKVVFRAKLVLLASEGIANRKIAQQMDASRPTVILWRQRFVAGGPEALVDDAPGRGRKPEISAGKIKQIVDATLQTKPKAATHWSVRTMAAAQGVSPASVQRIWDAHGLEPHRTRTFKLSRDKRFVEKLTDVVGLYLNPPDKALVICVDEKSQIQALDRTQPGLPMKKGRCGTMTHDYKRHGTTTLFAALDVLDGTVIGQCMSRHRHQEFIRFLNKINRETPAGRELHLIVDNYATHKHPKVRAWLERHPRFHFHFTPTSASWLNAVEGFFAKLTRQRLKRGVFTGIVDLQAAINRYLAETNDNPKPFTWTADPDAIIEKVRRGKQVLESIH